MVSTLVSVRHKVISTANGVVPSNNNLGAGIYDNMYHKVWIVMRGIKWSL
jgi:hypothetical protein